MGAKLKDLEKVLAEITHRPETELQTRSRWLREAGLLPTGRRGSKREGAPDIDARDCATLLLGLMVSEQAKDCPEVTGLLTISQPSLLIEHWKQLDRLPVELRCLFKSPDDELRPPETPIEAHGKGPSLLDAIAGLIELGLAEATADLLRTHFHALTVSRRALPRAELLINVPTSKGRNAIGLSYHLRPGFAQRTYAKLLEKDLAGGGCPPLGYSVFCQWQHLAGLARFLITFNEEQAAA